MSHYEEILHLIDELGAEVSSCLLTTEEAAQLMTYGNIVEEENYEI